MMGTNSLLNLISLTVTLVFGGCCSNVFTFEKLFHFPDMTDVGSFVTFCQFVYISLENIQIFNKKRIVPLRSYLISIVLFFLGSLGNNIALNYDISIPLHIVFRSFSPVITMTNGFIILRKKYNGTQVVSALFLTLGCIITSLYKDREFEWGTINNFFKTSHEFSLPSGKSFKGLMILFGSSYLISLLQLYNEWIFEKYGKGTWKEMVFYTHFLSIPLCFFASKNSILRNLKIIKNMIYTNDSQFSIHSFPVILLSNLVTQSLCVKGVNILSSNTNALTVSIVLLLRKMVSLVLSMYMFDTEMTKTAIFGAFVTFFGAVLYSLGSSMKTIKVSFEKKRK